MATPQDILDFWFGPERGITRKEWFRKDAAFDAEIKRRFGLDVERALAGGFSQWEMDSDGALALLLLLDQFPRNIHRDTAKSFAGDDRARSLAQEAIFREFDKGRPAVERLFFYLPFEHSERFLDQDRSVELVGTLGDAELLKWAQAHRDIVMRFGRFPHRNRLLGRASTPEEIEFLKQPDSSF